MQQGSDLAGIFCLDFQFLLEFAAFPEKGLSPLVLILYFFLLEEEVVDHVVDIVNLVLRGGEGDHFVLDLIRLLGSFLGPLQQLGQQFATHQVELLPQLLALFVLDVLE